MTVETTALFDVAAFKRTYEEWDIEAQSPGGRRVLANAVLELEDGRIVRELDVLSGDPKKA
jgi:hypothetical protein